MTPEQRKRIIFESLYGEQSGILRRYTAPDHLTPDRQRGEIMFMVDDLNDELPDLPDDKFMALIDAMHTYVRRNAHGRQWPTIQDFVKASRKVSGLMSEGHIGGGDINKLTPGEKQTLEKVLATARRWLDIPNLAAHGRKTLDYWGQQ
jgi:hypothetical protein